MLAQHTPCWSEECVEVIADDDGCSARPWRVRDLFTMRAELIGDFEPCMTEIYLHIDARMADYIRTHPY